LIYRHLWLLRLPMAPRLRLLPLLLLLLLLLLLMLLLLLLLLLLSLLLLRGGWLSSCQDARWAATIHLIGWRMLGLLLLAYVCR
jgi:hypothetical protein